MLRSELTVFHKAPTGTGAPTTVISTRPASSVPAEVSSGKSESGEASREVEGLIYPPEVEEGGLWCGLLEMGVMELFVWGLVLD